MAPSDGLSRPQADPPALLQSQQSYKPVAHAEDQEVILDTFFILIQPSPSI